MSYAVSFGLQAEVYQALTGSAALSGLVGGAIYDALPTGTLPSLYVALGPEEVRDRSDKTGSATQHDFVVSVVSDAAGFAAAKEAAGAVSDALEAATLSPARGSVVSLRFLRARAVRVGTGATRRINLTFRAYVEDD